MDTGSYTKSARKRRNRFALHTAVKHRNVTEVKYIIEKYSNNNIDKRDKNSRTPLYIAICNSDTEIAKLLLENGARIAACKTPPVIIAVRLSNADMVDLLLEHGANLEDSYAKETPLYVALYRKNYQIAELLLKRGADPSMTLYRNCASYLADIGLCTLLVNFNASFDVLDEIDNTPLHYAIHNGDVELVRFLLDNGASLEIQKFMHSAITPIYYHEILKLLVERGAYVNEVDDYGRSALHLLAYAGKTEGVDLLLVNKASPDDPDSEGKTPLYYAVSKGNISVAKSLLDYGATLFHENGECRELELAISSNDIRMLRLLLTKARVPAIETALLRSDQIKPCYGTRLIHSAVLTDNAEIISEVMSLGVDVNLKDARGFTPLHVAVESSKLNIVKLLLQNGAGTNIVSDYNKKSALHIATAWNAINSVRVLLDHGADVNALDDYDCTPIAYVNRLDSKLAATLVSHIVLSKHVHKHKTLMPIGLIMNYKYISRMDKLKEIKTMCEKELAILGNLKLNHRYAADAFLCEKNKNVLYKLVQNSALKGATNSIKFYKYILETNRKAALRRRRLIVKASNTTVCLYVFKRIPEEIRLRILEMLNNDDLESFVSSGVIVG